MSDTDMNPRTCIVTREVQNSENMIRFVLGPEDRVYPDLKCKLPGRGVWITNNRKTVEQAVVKGLFSRGFKKKASAEKELPEMLDHLLSSSALETISLAKKAGLLVPGQANAELAVRSGEAGVLLTATDASDGGRKKMDFAVQSVKSNENLTIPRFQIFECDALDSATGSVNVMHLAVLSGAIADKLVTQLNRLTQYRGLETEKAD